MCCQLITVLLSRVHLVLHVMNHKPPFKCEIHSTQWFQTSVGRRTSYFSQVVHRAKYFESHCSTPSPILVLPIMSSPLRYPSPLPQLSYLPGLPLIMLYPAHPTSCDTLIQRMAGPTRYELHHLYHTPYTPRHTIPSVTIVTRQSLYPPFTPL